MIDFAIVNDTLHYRDYLQVPDYHALRLHLYRLDHDSPHTGHWRIDNNYERLYRNYCWLKMQSFVIKYVRYCDTYKRSKRSQFKKQEIIHLLLVSDQKWSEISIDFITDIFLVKKLNAICNIVDRLQKNAITSLPIKKLMLKGQWTFWFNMYGKFMLFPD